MNYLQSSSYRFHYLPTWEELMIADVQAHPATAALYKEATDAVKKAKFDSITLKIVKNTQSGFAGEFDLNTGSISIQEGLPYRKKISVFLFELMNAIQTPKIIEITENLEKGNYKSAEVYAKVMEKLEYDNSVKHLFLLRKVNLEPYLKDDDPRTYIDFESYYSNYIGDAHKNIYRYKWETWNLLQTLFQS